MCVWGGGAVKAGWVCRLVLPGVPKCSPFEEGILHSWMGGLVVHPLEVKGAGPKQCERWGARSAKPNSRGKLDIPGQLSLC